MRQGLLQCEIFHQSQILEYDEFLPFIVFVLSCVHLFLFLPIVLKLPVEKKKSDHTAFVRIQFTYIGQKAQFSPFAFSPFTLKVPLKFQEKKIFCIEKLVELEKLNFFLSCQKYMQISRSVIFFCYKFTCKAKEIQLLPFVLLPFATKVPIKVHQLCFILCQIYLQQLCSKKI